MVGNDIEFSYFHLSISPKFILLLRIQMLAFLFSLDLSISSKVEQLLL